MVPGIGEEVTRSEKGERRTSGVRKGKRAQDVRKRYEEGEEGTRYKKGKRMAPGVRKGKKRHRCE